MGAAQSDQSQTDPRHRRSPGAAANSRATTGPVTRAAERGGQRSGTAREPLAGAAGGGSTPDTTTCVKVAALIGRRDTFLMAVPNMRGSLSLASVALAFCAIALPARADEIRLKGGRKLYGVIVAYEDNMFKVKTEYGYELIEKDKIESIIPSTPAGKSESATAKKDGAQHPAKPAGDSQPQAEPAVATSADAGTAASNASAKTINSGSAGKTDKASPQITSAAAKPEVPANTTASNAAAPAIKAGPAPTANGVKTAGKAPATAPAPPKEPQVPANREEIQGNLYTNYTHGFHMYKAPSCSLIEEARGALPNAI